MVVTQGDIFWSQLPEPAGSAPGYRRPVLIVQGEAINLSRINTVVVVPLTSSQIRAAAPGNVQLSKRTTGLPRDSVANVSQITTIDRGFLTERVGQVSGAQLARVLRGIDIILGR